MWCTEGALPRACVDSALTPLGSVGRGNQASGSEGRGSLTSAVVVLCVATTGPVTHATLLCSQEIRRGQTAFAGLGFVFVLFL